MTASARATTTKKVKLLKYCNYLRTKGKDFNSLHAYFKGLTYVVKYLDRDPKSFRNVFRHWIFLIKDILGNSTVDIKKYSFEKLSLIFLKVATLNFRPVDLIGPILKDWIDILILVPVEITAQMVEKYGTKLGIIINVIRSIGHYKLQESLVEIVNRYLLTVGDQTRRQILDAVFSDQQLTKAKDALYHFDIVAIEENVRLFLNEFNKVGPSSMTTFTVASISVGTTGIVHPMNKNMQWLDFNHRTPSLSFHGQSDFDSWTFFEIKGDNIQEIKRTISLLEIEILLRNPIVIDSQLDQTNGDFRSSCQVLITFTCADRLAHFMEFVTPRLNSPNEDRLSDRPIELEETVINLGDVDSKIMESSFNSYGSFHNGVIGSVVNEPPTVTRRETSVLPVKKRKLYSHVIPLPSPMSSVDRNDDPNISIHDQTSFKPNTTHPRSKIFRTERAQRVPIYQSVLEDWKSDDAGVSVYSFVCSDPPAPAKKPRKTATRKPRQTRTKKGPVKLVKTIRKPRTRETAEKAKQVLNLSRTPSCEDNTMVTSNPELEMRSYIERIYPCRRTKAVSGGTQNINFQMDFDPMMGEIQNIAKDIDIIMADMRKMKQRIASSTKLSEYQKSCLLSELCNALLK